MSFKDHETEKLNEFFKLMNKRILGPYNRLFLLAIRAPRASVVLATIFYCFVVVFLVGLGSIRYFERSVKTDIRI